MKALERHLQLLLEARDWKRLGKEMAALDPSRAAGIITDIQISRRDLLYLLLPAATAEAAFEQLAPDEKDRFIEALRTEIRGGAENPAAETEGQAPIGVLPGRVLRRLLDTLTVMEREALFHYLGYDETCIGRLVGTGFIALRPEFTTGEALEQIRRYGTGTEHLETLYVVDGSWKLLRTIGIRDLLLAPPERPVSELGGTTCTVLRAEEDREAVAARFRNGGPASLPVTDTAGTLLGVVSLEEILRIER